VCTTTDGRYSKLPEETTTDAARGLDDERMRRFVELYERAWADPTSGLLAELWDPDGEMLHPELEEPLHGPEAVMSYLHRILEIAPDLKTKPLAAASNGDSLFIHFQSQGTFGEKKVVWEGVDRWELDGEKAIWGVGFFDTAAMRQALESQR
jgi:hypothetical protein